MDFDIYRIMYSTSSIITNHIIISAISEGKAKNLLEKNCNDLKQIWSIERTNFSADKKGIIFDTYPLLLRSLDLD